MFYLYNNDTGEFIGSTVNAQFAKKLTSIFAPGDVFYNETPPCDGCQRAAHRCVCDPDEMENRLEHQHEEEELGPKCGHGRYLNSEGCHECEDGEMFQDRLDAYMREC